MCLDSHVHLVYFFVFTGRVLVVVALIISHVASAHLSVLHHQLCFELSKDFVVDQVKILDGAGSLRQRESLRDCSHLRELRLRYVGLMSLFGDTFIREIVWWLHGESRIVPFAKLFEFCGFYIFAHNVMLFTD